MLNLKQLISWMLSPLSFISVRGEIDDNCESGETTSSETELHTGKDLLIDPSLEESLQDYDEPVFIE